MNRAVALQDYSNGLLDRSMNDQNSGADVVLSHVEQCAKNAISQSNYNQEIEIKQQRKDSKS